MTGKPSGEIVRRKRRRAERDERVARAAQLTLDITLMKKFLKEATDPKEIGRLRMKLRTLEQRLQYLNL